MPPKSPQPLQQPHPPILIGGGGERKTLKFIAQYGDACNFFDRMGRDVLAHKLDVLRAHCDDVERPFGEIELTVLSTIMPGEESAAEIVTRLKTLRGLGFSHVIFNMPHAYELTPLRMIGREVIPAVADQ